MLIDLYKFNSSSSGKFSLFKFVDAGYGSYILWSWAECIFHRCSYLFPILYLSTTFYDLRAMIAASVLL